jgi:hypothetical protein
MLAMQVSWVQGLPSLQSSVAGQQFCGVVCWQTPLCKLHVFTVHALWSWQSVSLSQQFGRWTFEHVLATQLSVVHGLLSLQAAGFGVCTHWLLALQVSVVHWLLSLQSAGATQQPGAAVCTHAQLALQVSVVQAMLSLQSLAAAHPPGGGTCRQVPASTSQLSRVQRLVS